MWKVLRGLIEKLLKEEKVEEGITMGEDIAIFGRIKRGVVPAQVGETLIQDILMEIAGKFTNYRVITRENVFTIMREKGIDEKELSECTDEVEFGKVLQAEKVVVGNLEFIDRVYYLRLSLYDSSSGTIEKVVSRKCKRCSFKKLTEMLEESAKELFQGKL